MSEPLRPHIPRATLIGDELDGALCVFQNALRDALMEYTEDKAGRRRFDRRVLAIVDVFCILTDEPEGLRNRLTRALRAWGVAAVWRDGPPDFEDELRDRA